MPWWLTQHLLTVVVVSVLIHVVASMFRAGPVVRHALWTIVLVKLIIPPVFAWPWQVPALEAQQSAAAAVLTIETRPKHELVAEPAVATSGRTVNQFASSDPQTRPLTWRVAATTAWIVGAGLFGLIHVARAWRMHGLVRRSSDPPAELEVAVATIAARLRISPVTTRVAPVPSPFIWGLFRPVLVWPETLPAGIENTAVPSLLTHELAHVKRGDCWIGWIELIAGCVWWWNPIFWHVRSQLRASAELACDAWVGHVTPHTRRAYAEALLAVSAHPTSLPAPMPAIGMRSTSRRLMKRRIALIMRAHVPVRLSRTAFCAAAIVAVVVLPAWAQQAVTVPRPTPPAPVAAPAPATRTVVRPTPRTEQDVIVRRATQSPLPLTFTREVPPQGQPADVFYFANNEALPDAAQALVKSFDESSGQLRREAEEKITRERNALIEQLQKIQDTETKAGHLDEAVAVRNRIRVLQNSVRFTSGVPMPDTAAFVERAVAAAQDALRAAPPAPRPPAPPMPAR
jgi:beta-lactamase regulating signal transducer with metallopeptidase domain